MKRIGKCCKFIVYIDNCIYIMYGIFWNVYILVNFINENIA